MKVYLETLGCPKNFNDSEVALGSIKDQGFDLTENPEEADFLVVNTCGFINDAKTESINRLFELSQQKKEGAKLVGSGCLTQRYVQDLYQEMPEVDGFTGVNEYEITGEILKKMAGTQERLVFADGKMTECVEYSRREIPSDCYTSTIKIAEGCDNFCTYCSIPLIRGHFRSKKMDDIIREANELADRGCKEIVLVAQDVAAYGIDLYGKYMLSELLKRLCKVQGIQWIRLLYCYEDKITDELIETMASEEKVCNYIDIPLQHGADNVLKRMARKSTRKSIDETLAKLKKAMPDIHIRTTLITGFPGETEEDYEELLDFVETEQFARLGAFAYSREEGTPADRMDDQIEEEVKQERLDGIMRRQIDISLQWNKKKVGSIMEVMVDERDSDGSYIGRTRYDAPEIDNSVIFSSDRELKPGDIVKVRILDAFDYDLAGEEANE